MTRGQVAKTPYFLEHLLSGTDNGRVLLIKADSGLIDGGHFSMVCGMKYVRSTLDVRGVRSDLESRLKTGDLAHYPLPEDSQ